MFILCIGEGDGTPLQYSCLENPRDGGAWWAAVYGVTQSWTRPKWLSSSILCMVYCELEWCLPLAVTHTHIRTSRNTFNFLGLWRAISTSFSSLKLKHDLSSKKLNKYTIMQNMGLPGGTVVKNPPANAGVSGEPSSIPGLGRIPWRRKWQPTPVYLPGKSHGRRSLVGCSLWGH